ncbi:MAG: S-layer homology domain-containing protein, partial [Candidatus Ornithomonoglobus sp.]
MMKKLCALILAIGMLMSTFTAISALAYTDVESTKQATAVDLVTGLNIMSADSDEEFGSSTIVKRGEFALYAARLMNYNIVPSKTATKGYFDDVDVSTEEGAAVQMLAEMGVISIADEFNPNEGITYVAAIKILLCCAGYETAANQNGGYPNGYIKLATENDLTKNLSKSNDSALTKTETAVLLYNTLFIYPMELNNKDYTKGSETILEKIYNAYELTGIVTGYGDTSLLNKSMGDTQVSIDNIVYDCVTPNIKNYIGRSVKAYYTDVRGDGVKIVTFTEQDSKNTVTTIDVDDIDEITKTNLKYYPDGGATTKSIKIS